jgi:hypothetical protein
MKVIPYRITIELHTGAHDGQQGMTFVMTGETPDVRREDVRPTNYECTAMAATILTACAAMATEASADQQTFEATQAFIQMPTCGRPN